MNEEKNAAQENEEEAVATEDVAAAPEGDSEDAEKVETAAAEEADAEQFAPQTLSEAREFLLQAEALIREGSYNLARGDAVRARTFAISALQASQAAQQGEAP